MQASIGPTTSRTRARGVSSCPARRGCPAAWRSGASHTFLATEILSVDGLERARARAVCRWRSADPPATPPELGDHQVHRRQALRLRRAGSTVSKRSIWNRTSEAPAGSSSAPGYSTINAGISVPIGGHLQVFARALNLTDRQYEETLGYPALGRSGMVGVRVATSR